MDEVLRVEGLTGGYGKIAIVQDASLRAEAGKIVAIVGPNGAGKSTFLKIIAGVLPATSGTVNVNGQSLAGLPANKVARMGLAYVPQESNVFPTLNIRENLEMGGFILRGDLSHRIDHIYGIFPDLKTAEHKKAGSLSGGLDLLGVTNLASDVSIGLFDLLADRLLKAEKAGHDL